MLRTSLETIKAVSIVALVLASWPCQAQFNFDPAVGYGSMLRPSGVAVGDFNGDNMIDLATTADAVDRVVLLPNAGNGTFPTMNDILLPISSSPQDLIAGDFDGDTDVDLAVALRDPAGSIQILLNNGAGLFASGGSVAVGDRPRGLSIADMDGDEDLDLAVANRDGNSASILRNNGSGTFAATTVATGGEPLHTAFGDFFGDDRLELAVTNHDDRTVTILAADGAGFSSVATLSVGNNNRPDGVTAADLNGDGLEDLAVTADNFATVFLNQGASFGGPISYATGGVNSSEILAGDWDCDGHPDLAVTNSDSNNVSLLRNNGNGTFAAGQLLAVGTTPGEAAFADLDGGHGLDIAVANRDSNQLSVLLNATCVALPGDFDGNGSFDCADVDALVGEIAAGTGDIAFDLTGDGAVNGDDLTEWLSIAGAANLPSGNAYLPGDATLDGQVDISDFNQWNANKFTSTAAWCSGDFNADGSIDVSDFNIWTVNKFTSSDAVSAVPEPTSTLLSLLAACCCLMGYRRSAR